MTEVKKFSNIKMTVFYVSGTGDDRNTGRNKSAAFRTLQKAADLAQAGDTVYVMDGVYTNKYANILNIANKQGTINAPIIFAAYPGHKPVLKAQKNNWNAISITGSSYILIEGLTLLGARDEITLEYALLEKSNTRNPATSGNGINITYVFGTPNKRSHHIVINNNTVTNFPGGGISAIEADYITITNNVVSGNAWYSPFGCQGISCLQLWNSDTKTQEYKVVIEGNKCFYNKQLVPWISVGEITEGHGIMLDTSYLDGVAYLGKALISNNLSYKNGGAGIQIFKGENRVDVVNNTLYGNSEVLRNGEIFLNKAKNVVCERNIFYARTGQEVAASSNSTNVLFNNNLAYNGVFKGVGTGNIIDKDPMFVDAENNDFTLRPETPAIWTDIKQEMRLVNVPFSRQLGVQN